MFGLPSIQKLLVLAAIVGIVWYGFKFLGKLQKARAVEAKERRKEMKTKGARPRETRSREGAEAVVETEDMVPCPVCGAYVQARGASACERGDCPY
jgi:uncharacterized protein